MKGIEPFNGTVPGAGNNSTFVPRLASTFQDKVTGGVVLSFLIGIRYFAGADLPLILKLIIFIGLGNILIISVFFMIISFQTFALVIALSPKI